MSPLRHINIESPIPKVWKALVILKYKICLTWKNKTDFAGFH